jgi:hypothetical protein
VFYGFIAVRDEHPNQAILAIRGTSNGVEWWDDCNSLGLTAFRVPGFGNVGLVLNGFTKRLRSSNVRLLPRRQLRTH